MAYQTSDGRTFDDKWRAESHANDLAREEAREEARRERFNREIEKKVQSNSDMISRGNSYLEKGDYDEAIKIYSKNIELIRGMNFDGDTYSTGFGAGRFVIPKVNLYTLYNNRGVAYERLGNKEAAIADYIKAADGGHSTAKGNLERLDVDYDTEVIERLEQSAKNATTAKEHCSIGWNYYFNDKTKWKDKDKAIAEYSKAIEVDPKYADAYFWRGKIYKENGEYDKAIADFNEALRLNPKEKDLYYDLRCETYELKGDLAHAIADCKASIRVESYPYREEKLEKLKEKIRASGYKSSSSYSSSDKGNIVLSVIFAIVAGIGAIMFGTSVINLKGILYLLVILAAAVLGFIAWRNKKTFLKIILLGVLVVGIAVPIIKGSGKAPKSQVQTATEKTVTVNNDSLNLRSKPSTEGQILNTLKRGDVLTVTGEEENGWLPVQYGSFNGYVGSQYVK